jgi:exodeoxyribonuclease VII small subunit
MKKIKEKGSNDPGYREALQEIEKLLAKIEDPETSFDQLSLDVKRATELVEYCRKQLRSYKEEIDNISQNK